MYKSRLFVRGYGFLGQMGMKNEYYLKEWTPLEIFDNVGISKIKTTLGQSFVCTKEQEVFFFGWPFDSANITKTFKALNPPDIFKYYLLTHPSLGKYFFIDKHVLPIKLKTPVQGKIKDLAGGNGVVYILDEEGELSGMGDNERGQLGVSCDKNNQFVRILSGVAKISAGLQHLLVLDNKGTLLGCGASNYCQLPTRNRNIKEIKNLEIFNEFFKCADISAGNFHSLFLEEKRKKIFAVGQNFKMQCGLSLEKSEILEVPEEVFDLQDFTHDSDEYIIKIKSGSSHNIYLTNKRLLFSGNNQKNQFPAILGNQYEKKGYTVEEMNFKQLQNFKFEDIIHFTLNFDRTSITFKNGSSFLFGGIHEDKNFEAKEFEIFDNIQGMKIKKIIPGLHWEFAICENY